MRPFIILLLFPWSMFSCEKESLPYRQSSRLEAFDKIELKDAFEVFLTEDSIYSVEVQGAEEVLDFVKISVKDSTMYIENTRKATMFTPRKNKISIFIHTRSLKLITTAEGCRIKTLNPITSKEFGLVMGGKVTEADIELNANTMYFWNNFPGGGKLTLSGTVEILKIWNVALMSVDAKNLLAKYAEIENSSQGDCEAMVTEKLDYKISGTGNIHLYGTTAEAVGTTSLTSGRLIRH